MTRPVLQLHISRVVQRVKQSTHFCSPAFLVFTLLPLTFLSFFCFLFLSFLAFALFPKSFKVAATHILGRSFGVAGQSFALDGNLCFEGIHGEKEDDEGGDWDGEEEEEEADVGGWRGKAESWPRVNEPARVPSFPESTSPLVHLFRLLLFFLFVHHV